MTQLSDDCFAFGDALLPLEDARKRIADLAIKVTGDEKITVPQALGRILAQDLVASHDVPPHDNSAVDGYAVFHADLNAEGETTLPVTARIAAGHPLGRSAKRGEALRIFTGAVMPTNKDGEGPDTIFMQEDCTLGDGAVTLPAGIKAGANRRKRGEDITTGTVLLHAGRRLMGPDLGQAAACGLTHITVAKPLRVALFSTGDELAEPGTPLPAGAIYDSNRFTLMGLLTANGAKVSDLGRLPDQREIVTQALAAAAKDHDMILTSGGVSTGEEDHVRAAVEAGGTLHFWRLAIKPGRPLALGQVGGVPFVGLPGNPAAAVVVYANIIRPLVLGLMGAKVSPPLRFAVAADFSHKKKAGRREWLRVTLTRDDQGHQVLKKFPREGAGILSSLTQSNGFAELPEDMTRVEPGAMLDFIPFSEVLM